MTTSIISSHSLGPKCDRFIDKIHSEQGQISIFFSASLIVLITIIAFVINVGLFVKAKINLQNATDAAAYAGAAVQARHLTKIAYLNWEMRNVYKEWMFKYYVLGNTSLENVRTPQGQVMDFTMRDDLITTDKDPYNFPSVCIHLQASTQATSTNICKIYSIPGIPVFESIQAMGIEDASQSFIDAIEASKIDDCKERSRLNMLVATMWTYNVSGDETDDLNIATYGPSILAKRQGAYPKALEIAIRIRNLEYAFNREPISDGVCNETQAGINCSNTINSIISDNKYGNERISKAFYSGYRNLGNDVDSEMKESFTLTELAPTIASVGSEKSLSYLLVPNDKNTYPKPYLDLKLMPVNLAIFYSSFMPSVTQPGLPVQQTGACDVTKLAIPVPGYPLGFYKNPDVLTYYAVKGEAQFIGMFNPFQNLPIKLTAFASAKPFGGRIGPMLYTQDSGSDQTLVGRKDAASKRSTAYITSLDFTNLPKKGFPNQTLNLGEYAAGAPLPINNSGANGFFWLEDENSPIGGPGTANDVQFGVPNMIYDYNDSSFDTSTYSTLPGPINVIRPQIDHVENPIGLYNVDQFRLFRNNIPGDLINISADELLAAIYRVKAPTRYEAANYLVPIPETKSAGISDAFSPLTSAPTDIGGANDIEVYQKYLYAPLFSENGEDTLYSNAQSIAQAMITYINDLELAINKYQQSLNIAAKTVYYTSQGNSNWPGYQAAARGISDLPESVFTASQNTNAPLETAKPQTCRSIAGQFMYFIFGHRQDSPVGDSAGCPKPYAELIQEYFSNQIAGGNSNFSPSYYNLEYTWKTSSEVNNFLTGYVPGPSRGATNDGEFTSLAGGSKRMRRNFYSTKFVPLSSLIQGNTGYQEIGGGNFPIYSEGEFQGSGAGAERSQKQFLNSLNQTFLPQGATNLAY